MSAHVSGIHHVTAYAYDPQDNLDFYTGVLGLRLVKQTVLFNNPSEVFKGPTMYHFYYADEVGTPGTVMTFKPHHSIQQGQVGRRQATATAFTIPEGAVDYWTDRLGNSDEATLYPTTERFGRTVIPFQDHDGQPLELITGSSDIEPWADGPVPAEHAIRGFHGVTIHPDNVQQTAAVLELLGYEQVGHEPTPQDGDWTRFQLKGTEHGQFIEAALPVGEAHLFAGAGENLPFAGHHRGGVSPTANVASLADRVAVQGPADRTGDSDQCFQPGQSLADRMRDHMRQFRPASGSHRVSGDADLAKLRRGQVNHQPRHSLVADQQIRAAAKQADRQLGRPAALDQFGEFLAVGRLGEILSRPAQAEPVVRRQRLVLADDMFQAGEVIHGSGCGSWWCSKKTLSDAQGTFHFALFIGTAFSVSNAIPRSGHRSKTFTRDT